MRNETENPLSLSDQVELFELEKLMEDDLHCESLHLETGKENCSVKVTHIAIRKHSSKRQLFCKVSADWDLGQIQKFHDEQCDSCKLAGFSRTVSECWSYQPI